MRWEIQSSSRRRALPTTLASWPMPVYTPLHTFPAATPTETLIARAMNLSQY